MPDLNQLLVSLGRRLFGRRWSDNSRHQGLQVMLLSLLLAGISAVLAAIGQLMREYEIGGEQLSALGGDLLGYIAVGIFFVACVVFAIGMGLHWMSLFSQRK